MMTRMVVNDMKARGKGAIVNISSGSELQPLPFMAVYAASKVTTKCIVNCIVSLRNGFEVFFRFFLMQSVPEMRCSPSTLILFTSVEGKFYGNTQINSNFMRISYVLILIPIFKEQITNFTFYISLDSHKFNCPEVFKKNLSANLQFRFRKYLVLWSTQFFVRFHQMLQTGIW